LQGFVKPMIRDRRSTQRDAPHWCATVKKGDEFREMLLAYSESPARAAPRAEKEKRGDVMQASRLANDPELRDAELLEGKGRLLSLETDGGSLSRPNC